MPSRVFPAGEVVTKGYRGTKLIPAWDFGIDFQPPGFPEQIFWVGVAAFSRRSVAVPSISF